MIVTVKMQFRLRIDALSWEGRAVLMRRGMGRWRVETIVALLCGARVVGIEAPGLRECSTARAARTRTGVQ